MAKKDKHSRSKVPEKKSKKSLPWIVGAISVAIVVLVVFGNILFSGSGDKSGKSFQSENTRPVPDPSSDSGNKKGKSFSVQGGEIRPVLEPSLFKGRVSAAYAAAKKYPEVMDQVYCYCYCDNPPFNHKSLLSCFTERHGAG